MLQFSYVRALMVLLVLWSLLHGNGCLKHYDMLGAVCSSREHCNGLDCVQQRCIPSVANGNQNNNQNNQNNNQNNQNNNQNNNIGEEPELVGEQSGPEAAAEEVGGGDEAGPETAPEPGAEAGPEAEPNPETALPEDGGSPQRANFSETCSPVQPCAALQLPSHLSHMTLFCGKARKGVTKDTCVVSGCKNDQDCQEFCTANSVCSPYSSKFKARCLGSPSMCLWDDCVVNGVGSCFPGWQCAQTTGEPPGCSPVP